MEKEQKPTTVSDAAPARQEQTLFDDVCLIIDSARQRLATYANAEAVKMNWSIGKRIKEDILHNQRAEYGSYIYKTLSERLTQRYGKGWGEEKLKHCVRSAYVFSEEQIMYALRTQLSWTHIRTLMGVNDELARHFYMEMSHIEHWNTRTLEEKIDSQLYERTAISRKPEDVIRNELAQVGETNQILPDMVFRSSYFLDMLGLPDAFSESDLESAIISQIQLFIKELGSDFAFLDRQKRITVDAVDYYIDLLFYHRGLKRLVGQLSVILSDFDGAVVVKHKILDVLGVSL